LQPSSRQNRPAHANGNQPPLAPNLHPHKAKGEKKQRERRVRQPRQPRSAKRPPRAGSVDVEGRATRGTALTQNGVAVWVAEPAHRTYTRKAHSSGEKKRVGSSARAAEPKPPEDARARHGTRTVRTPTSPRRSTATPNPPENSLRTNATTDAACVRTRTTPW